MVLLYAGMADEPDLIPLIDAGHWSRERCFCFPRVRPGRQLTLHEVADPASFVRGPFGIREPDPARCREIAPSEIDVALIPGLGFDPDTGVRLGRGGGYYDRLLGRRDFRAPRLGVCFAVQIRRGLPDEPHDQAVHQIVTEDGLLAPGGGSAA